MSKAEIGRSNHHQVMRKVWAAACLRSAYLGGELSRGHHSVRRAGEAARRLPPGEHQRRQGEGDRGGAAARRRLQGEEEGEVIGGGAVRSRIFVH